MTKNRYALNSTDNKAVERIASCHRVQRARYAFVTRLTARSRRQIWRGWTGGGFSEKRLARTEGSGLARDQGSGDQPAVCTIF